MPRVRYWFWIVRAWLQLRIQKRTRLNANASKGGSAASSIGFCGLVGGVRRKLVMAAPADQREHASTIPKLKLHDFNPSSAPPSTDRNQMIAKDGTFPFRACL